MASWLVHSTSGSSSDKSYSHSAKYVQLANGSWTNIPSRWSRNTPSRFMLQKLGSPTNFSRSTTGSYPSHRGGKKVLSKIVQERRRTSVKSNFTVELC